MQYFDENILVKLTSLAMRYFVWSYCCTWKSSSHGAEVWLGVSWRQKIGTSLVRCFFALVNILVATLVNSSYVQPS